MLESDVLEFKREFSKGIVKTAIAFANTDGGELLVGVEDNGEIIGLGNPQDVILQISNTLKDAIRPDIMMFVSLEIETIGEKPIIRLKVERGTVQPYYLGEKGIRPEGVFIRKGASTIPASEAILLKMIRETSGNRYESGLSLNQELTFEFTSKYFEDSDLPFERVQQKTLRLINSDESYTNLGYLLSDQCAYSVKFAVFEGSNKRVFQDRREFTGPVLKQLEDVYDVLDRYNKKAAIFSGLKRKDIRDYPEEAVRESLLNALVHREYGISASTLISIFDDRIEFITLGSLMKEVSLSDIMLGVSMLRNPYLANVFYRLELIEAYGTGMQKIMENYLEYDFKPKIDLSDNAFKITLPNINFHRRKQELENERDMIFESAAPLYLTEKEQAVLKMISLNGFVTRAEIEEALGMSQATAIRLLRDLLAKGVIQKEREKRSIRYRLKKRI